jgi:hypothetical protein
MDKMRGPSVTSIPRVDAVQGISFLADLCPDLIRDEQALEPLAYFFFAVGVQFMETVPLGAPKLDP